MIKHLIKLLSDSEIPRSLCLNYAKHIEKEIRGKLWSKGACDKSLVCETENRVRKEILG